MEAVTPTRRYIAVLEGEGPGTSRTILATADPDTVTEVMRIIRERIERLPPALALDPGDGDSTP